MFERNFKGFLWTVLMTVTIISTALFTIDKYSQRSLKKFYPRMDLLEPLKLNEPSIGTLPAIVRLYDKDDKFFCTGTVISEHLVLTAAHCVLNDDGLTDDVIYVKSDDKLTKIEARAASAYSRLDVAVIHGDFKSFKYMEVLSDAALHAQMQGPFLSCGYPAGASKIFCVVFTPESLFNFGIIGRSIAWPGQSGSAVFSLTTNQIIGVISYVTGDRVVVGPTVELFNYLSIEVVK